ncbi:VCBS domain-containing protein [Marinobacterium sp. YM272]|uniref:VCBS domain-containing protein n=1 Tax=Marinobacterium sp. YM272 TaxID=3421654 RepID=UPI003D7F5608
MPYARVDEPDARQIDPGKADVLQQAPVSGGVGQAASGQAASAASGSAGGGVSIEGDFTGQLVEDQAASAGQLQTSGALDIADAQSGGAHFIVQQATPGHYGAFSIDGAGRWSYSADNAQTAIQQLNAGQQLVERFTVSTANGVQQTVTIAIQGTNDAPELQAATFSTDEDAGVVLGRVQAQDVDSGDQLTFSLGHAVAGLTFNADGSYRFDPSHPDYQYLASGQQLQLTLPVTVTDRLGAQDSRDFVLTLTGTNDAPVLTKPPQLNVREDSHSITGTLVAGDVDTLDRLSFSLSSPVAGFSIDDAGHYTFDPSHPDYQHLDEGQVLTLKVPVTVTDSQGASDTQDLVITLTGTNDTPVMGQMPFVQVDEGEAVYQGRLQATDPDSGASLSFSLNAPVQGLTLLSDGSYSFDPSNAVYQQLAAGEVQTLTVPVTVTDEHGSSDTQNLVITLTGTDDKPVLQQVPGLVVHEDDKVVQGQLLATDADSGDTLAYSQTQPVAGFTLQPDGHYTFDPSHPDYQHLDEGQVLTLKVPVTVTDSQGASDTQDLVITLTGTNDTPVMGQMPFVQVDEDGAVYQGQLQASDPDSGASLSFSLNAPVQGLTLLSDGSYSFDPSNAVYQQLAAGEVQTLTVPVTVTDEHGSSDTQNLVITLTGTDDKPVLQQVPGLVVHEGDKVVQGQLLATDADNGDTLAYSQTQPVAGFTLQSDGHYTFDPSHAAYQSLAEGERQLITIPVQVTDSQGQTDSGSLVIQLVGTNDGPALLGTPPQNVAEDDVVLHGRVLSSDLDRVDTAQYSTAVDVPGFVMYPDGSYDFDPSNPAYQSLAEGEVHEVKVPVIVTDSQGATDSEELLIRVTGTNDRPVLVTVPDFSVSEGAGVVTGQLTATDIDTTDQLTFALTQPIPGFSLDPDGHYSFDPTDLAYDHLAPGDHQILRIPVEVRDGHGGTDGQILEITINGTDDAPILANTPMQRATEDSLVQGRLLATDVDDGDTLVFSTPIQQPGLTINPDGSYTFDASHPDYQSLAAGEVKDLIVPITVTDSHGESARGPLHIRITGTNDLPLVGGVDHAMGTVQGAQGGRLHIDGALMVHDIDAGESSFTPQLINGSYGTLAIDPDGRWSYTADTHQSGLNSLQGQQHVDDTFTVRTADGTQHDIAVRIKGSNAPAIFGGVTSGMLKEDGLDRFSGHLVVNDPNVGEAEMVPVDRDTAHGHITMTASGDWVYTINSQHPDVQALAESQMLTENILVGSIDGTPLQLVVNIIGTNDVPTIVGTSSGVIDEDQAGNTVSDTLTAQDIDTGHQLGWAVQGADQGIYGSLAIDPATGQWTYTLDNSRAATQGLTEGQVETERFTVVVTDEQGASATQVITVTVQGSNDLPVITSTSSTTTPDDDTAISGTLSISDVDAGEAHFTAQTDTDGQYGTFSISADGHWTYTPDDRADAIDKGQTGQEVFKVTSADGTEHSVTITVTGSSEYELGGDTTGSAVEDTATTISGDLQLTDSGRVETAHFGDHVLQGTYGSLDLRDQGHWIYNLNNQDAGVQGLKANEVVEENFHITMPDGTTQDVVIRVTGTHDQPQIQAIDSHPLAQVEGATQISDVTGSTDLSMFSELVQGVSVGQKLVALYMPGDDENKLDGIDPTSLPTIHDAYRQAAGSGYVYLDSNGWFGQNVPEVDSQAVAPSVRNNWDGGIAVFEDGSVVRLVKVCDGHNASEHDYIYFKRVEHVDANIGVTVISGRAAAGEQVEVYEGSQHLGTATADSQGIWQLGTSKLADGDHAIHTVVGGVSTDPVTLSVAGDQVDVNEATPVLGSTTEDNAAEQSLSGQMHVTDADTGDNPVFTEQAGTSGRYGTFSIDSDGNWHYELDNSRAATQSLADGHSAHETFVVEVTTNSGETQTQTVQVNVVGTNDAPVVSQPISLAAGTEDTDVTLSLTQLLANATDLDQGETAQLSVQNLQADHGTVTDNRDGTFTFHPDANYNGPVSFTYDVQDPQGAVVSTSTSMTLAAVQDAAVIAGDNTGTVQEDRLTGSGSSAYALRASGTLTIQDPDAGEAEFEEHRAPLGFGSDTTLHGRYGSLTIFDNGNWDYEANNNQPDIQQLGTGDTPLTDPFVVHSVDGTPYTITISITGTNDVPTLTADSAATAADFGSVDEDTGKTFTETELLQLVGAQDVDASDTLSISAVTIDPQYGRFTQQTDGSWKFSPAGDFSGDVPISLTVTDGTDDVTAHGAIAVTPVADQASLSVTAMNSAAHSTITCADFSTASSQIVFDPTTSGYQSPGQGEASGYYQVSQVTGGSGDDIFRFTDLKPGDAFTVVGGQGTNRLDLSNFKADQVSIDTVHHLATVHLPGGDATIHYADISDFGFDTSATDGNPHKMETTGGNWTITGTELQATDSGSFQVALVGYAGSISENFVLSASVNAHQAGSTWQNGGIVFDYQDENNYKVVMLRAGAGGWSIEQVSNGQASQVEFLHEPTLATKDVEHVVELRVNGSVAELWSGGVLKVSHDFHEPLNDGRIGVAADHAHTDFRLSMQPSDWAPVAESPDLTMDTRDGSLTTTDLVAAAVDPEGQEVTLATVDTTSAHGGAVIDNGDGTFSYTPPANFTGMDSFTYTVTDGVNETSATVRVSVQDASSVSLEGGATFNLDISAAATDVDGSETLATEILGLPAGFMISDGIHQIIVSDPSTPLDVSGWALDQVEVTAPLTYTGTQDFEVRAETSDGSSTAFVSRTITLNVLVPTPDAIITGAGGNLQEDQSVDSSGMLTTSGALTVNDSVDAQAAFTPVTGAAGAGSYGTFTLDAQGHWTYSADNSQQAIQSLAQGAQPLTDSIIVRSLDGTEHTLSVTIEGTNDTPTVTADNAANAADLGSSDLGQPVHFGESDLLRLVGAADVDSADHLSISTVAIDPTVGSFAKDVTSGDWVFTPAAGASATNAAVQITVTDGTTPVTAQAALDVTPPPPLALTGITSDTGTDATDFITADNTLVLSGSGSPGDTIRIMDGPFSSLGSTTVDATGHWSFDYTGTALRDGTHHIMLLGKNPDGTNGSVEQPLVIDTGTPTITIDPVSQDDVFDSTDQGSPMVITGSVTHVDDGNTVTIEIAGKTYTGSVHGDTWSVTIPTADASALQDQNLLVQAHVETTAGTPAQAQHHLIVSASPDTLHSSGQVQEDITVTHAGQVFQLNGAGTVDTPTRLDGNFGSLIVDASGQYHYQLNNNAPEVQTLGQGESVSDHFLIPITLADGSHKLAQVDFDIAGTNDAPTITGGLSAERSVQTTATTHMSTTGQVVINDVDTHDTLSLTINGQQVDLSAGTAKIDTAVGQLTIRPNGNWEYMLDKGGPERDQLNSLLHTGGSQQERFYIVLTDNHGESRVADIVVNITGDAGNPTLRGTLRAAVVEDATLEADGVLNVVDANGVKQTGVTGWAVDASHSGSHGTFTIDAQGHWHYTLNNADPAVQALAGGEQLTDHATINAVDANGQQISRVIDVDITGTNDAPIITGDHVGNTAEDSTASISGKLLISDVDTTDAVSFTAETVRGNYGSLTVDANGHWTYQVDNSLRATQGLNAGQTEPDTIEVTATSTDGSSIKRVITINVTGSEDSPVIAGSHTGAVTEDAATATITGDLTATDADLGDNPTFQSLTDLQGTYGKLSIDATGHWTYSLDNSLPATQALLDGHSQPDTFTVTATTVDGETVTQDITVTVTGTNDAPTVTAHDAANAADLGTTSEDTSKTFTEADLLQLVGASDADSGDTLHVTAVTSPHGTFTQDATSGDWTFTPAANYHGDDVQVSLTINDGHTDVTAHGTIDVTSVTDVPTPSVTVTAEQEVMEFAAGSASGVVNTGTVNAGGTMHGITIDMTILGGDQVSSSGGHGATLISYGTSSDYNHMYIWNDVPGKDLTFRVGGQEYATGVEMRNDGHDHRYTFSWDGNAGTLDVLVDGQVVKQMTGVGQGATIEDGGKFALGNDQDSFGGGFSANDAFTGKIFNVGIAKTAVDTAQLQTAQVGSLLQGDSDLLTVIHVQNGRFVDQTGNYQYHTVGSVHVSTVEVDTSIAPPNPGALLSIKLSAGAPADTDDQVTAQSLVGLPAGTVISDGHGHSVTITDPTHPVEVQGWTLSSLTAQLPASYTDNILVDASVTTTGPDGQVESANSYAGVVLDPTKPMPQASSSGAAVTLASDVSLTLSVDTNAQATSINIDPVTQDNILEHSEYKGLVTVTGTVSGNFENGDTVTINVDNISFTGQVDASGVFAVEVPAAALAADNELEASISPAQGGGTFSETLRYGVDIREAGGITVELVDDTGNPTDHLTSNGALNFIGEEVGGRLEFSTDGGQTWEPTFAPQEGHNQFQVRQIDAHGNVSGATDFAFTLDTQVGNLAVNLPDAGSDNQYSPDELSANGTLTAEIQLPSDAVAGDTLTIDGTDYTLTSQDISTGVVQHDVTPGQQLAVSFTDQAGNTSTVATSSVSQFASSVSIDSIDNSLEVSVDTRGGHQVHGQNHPGQSDKWQTNAFETTSGDVTIHGSAVGVADGSPITVHLEDRLNPQNSFDLQGTVSGGQWSVTIDHTRVDQVGDHDWQVNASTADLFGTALHATTEIINTDGLSQTLSENGAAGSLDLLDGADQINVAQVLYSTDGTHFSSQLPAGVSLDADGHTLHVDPNSSAFDHLAPGDEQKVYVRYQLTETVGGTAEQVDQTAVITVTGTDDLVRISGTTSSLLDTATSQSAQGTLAVTDPDSAVPPTDFVVQSSTAGTFGSFSVDINGDWTYTLDPDNPATRALAAGEQQTDTFTVTTSDGLTHDVVVTVTGADDLPEITGTTSAVADDTTGQAQGSLAVTDPDDPQFVSTTSFVAQTGVQGQYGSFEVNAQGQWHYTLDPSLDATRALKDGEQQPDTFTVTTADGKSHEITVTVTGTNDAPTVSGSVHLPNLGDESPVTITEAQLLSHTSDIDLTASESLSVSGVTVDHGSITNHNDGTWTYTPESGYTGNVHFSYQVADEQHGTTPASADLTIFNNDLAPTVTATDSAHAVDLGNTAEDTTMTFTEADLLSKVGAHDSDATDTLSISDITSPHGTFTKLASGEWEFTPEANYHGDDVAISIQVSDGRLATTAQAVIDISSVTDAAIISASVTGVSTITRQVETAVQSLVETATGTTDTPLDLLYLDAAYIAPGTPGNAVAFTVPVGVDNHCITGLLIDGQLVSGDPVYCGLWNIDKQDTVVFPNLDIDAFVNAQDITFQFADNAPAELDIKITYDWTGNGSGWSEDATGGLTSEAGTLHIDRHGTVMEMRDIDVFASPEDAPILLDIDVQASVADDQLASIVIMGIPDGATLSAGSHNADGSWTLAPADLAGLTLTPAQDWRGDIDLQIVAKTSDGTQEAEQTSTLSVTVAPVADVPTVTVNAVRNDEDSTFDLDIQLGGHFDAHESQSIEISGIPVGSSLSAGTLRADGVWVLTPQELPNLSLALPKDYETSLTLDVKGVATDEGGVTGSLTVQMSVDVNPLEDAPDIRLTSNPVFNEDTSYTFKQDDFGFHDVDSADSLHHVTLTQLPASGALLLNGQAVTAGQQIDAADIPQLVFQPAKDFQGHLSLGFTVNDGQLDSAESVMELDVINVNDAATFTGDKTGSMTDDKDALATISGKLTVHDIDSDDRLAVHSYTGEETYAGSNGWGSLKIDPDGNWEYTLYDRTMELPEGKVVTDSVTVHSSDGTPQVITVTITGTNQAPIAGASVHLPDETSGTPFTISEAALLANAHDVDLQAGEELTVHNLHAGYSTVNDNGDGTFTITPQSGYTGEIQLFFDIQDPLGGVSPGLASLDIVAPSTTASVSSNDTVASQSVVEDQTVIDEHGGHFLGAAGVVSTDADGQAISFAGQTVTGDHGGSLLMTQLGGVWQARIDNDSPEVQALNTGESFVETFTVTDTDGNTHDIKITVEGTDEGVQANPAPPASDESAGTLVEEAALISSDEPESAISDYMQFAASGTDQGASSTTSDTSAVDDYLSAAGVTSDSLTSGGDDATPTEVLMDLGTAADEQPDSAPEPAVDEMPDSVVPADSSDIDTQQDDPQHHGI